MSMVETSTRIVKIGRAAENDVVIAQAEVSNFHAEVRQISANTWLLEDRSTNGTEVDGLRVQRTLLTPESRVVLSQRYPLDLSVLFPPPPPARPPTPAEHRAAFQRLSGVFQTYDDTRRALLRNDAARQGVIRGGCGLIPVIGGAIGQILASRYINTSEKLYALENELKLNYVCPQCKTYLGNVPFQALVNQRQCARCKLDWV